MPRKRQASAVGSEAADKQPNLLVPLLQTKGALLAEYRKRRNPFAFLTAHPADEAKYLAEGWAIHRRGKRAFRLKRAKAHDDALEDRVWCLFYRMGYPEIGGSHFKVKYQRRDGSLGEKQIDVFAKDHETVIIGECKSRDSRGRRSFQKDLHETESLQKPIANSIRKYYGQAFAPKIIWLYFTQNIIWSEPDVERADAISVKIVTENEFNYYDAFIKHIGPAGRFQFLAEFLQGQKIPGLSSLRVPATRGKLGKQTFYSFVTSPRTLLKIAFVNHLALNHPDGRPAYQRMISRSRIKEIGNFIRAGGYFPTNLLINFTERVNFDLLPNKDNSDPNIRFGWLHLPNEYKSAWVIDGQHRLYGFSHLPESYLDASIFIIAFEKMNTKTEADLFITINDKQKRVSKSIRMALQSDLNWGSAEPRERIVALASGLVKALNADATSPFFQRFVSEGVPPGESQSLTLPEAVKGLVRANVLGRASKAYSHGYLSAGTDEETVERARRVLNGYFHLLREANVARWEGGKARYVATNPSIRAHFLLIAETFRHLQSKRSGFDPPLAKEEDLIAGLRQIAEPVFSFVRTATDELVASKFARKFGEGGVREYFFNLCELIHGQRPDFGSDEFISHLQKRGDARKSETHQAIIDLEESIHAYVIYVLKNVYGAKEMQSGEKAYWELGIENAKAKEDAYKRQQETQVDKRLPKEAYLDLLDLMRIVRQKRNWAHCESVFNIPLPGEKGKVYYLDWMERLNELRRIAAHPSPMRNYDEEDYTFVDWLKREFYGRLEKTDFPDRQE